MNTASTCRKKTLKNSLRKLRAGALWAGVKSICHRGSFRDGLRGILTPFCDALFQVVHRIAAEFFQQCIGQHNRYHRFADHARSGHGAIIGTLDVRAGRLTARRINRRQRFHQRRNRFHRHATNQRFAIGDAAFESARVVAAARQRRIMAVIFCVVRMK